MTIKQKQELITEIVSLLLDALYEILGDYAKRERPNTDDSSHEDYTDMMAAFWSDMPEQLQEYACIGEELNSILSCNRWHNNFGEYFGNKNSTLTQGMNKIINHYKTKTGEYYYVDKIGSVTNPLNIANPNRVSQIVAFIESVKNCYKNNSKLITNLTIIENESLANKTYEIADVDFFENEFLFNLVEEKISVPINAVLAILEDGNNYDLIIHSELMDSHIITGNILKVTIAD